MHTDVLSLYLGFWLALLGAMLGSFFACAAQRAARGESALRGRSRCDSCGHALAARDLVPVASYLACRGRCRYCGKKIPLSDFWAEIAGACIFAAFALHTGPAPVLGLWLGLGAGLLYLSLRDIAQRVLPDWVLLALAALRLVYWALEGFSLPELGTMALGAVSVAAPLLAVVLLMDRVMGRETMGGGDIKLMAVLGLYFPWEQMLFLLLAACALGIVGGLAGHGRRGEGTLPFGPYIAAAAVLTVLLGPTAVGWYLSLFAL